MEDEINCSYNDGGDVYLLKSVAIHFNHTVCIERRNFHVTVWFYDFGEKLIGHENPIFV